MEHTTWDSTLCFYTKEKRNKVRIHDQTEGQYKCQCMNAQTDRHLTAVNMHPNSQFILYGDSFLSNVSRVTETEWCAGGKFRK